MTIGGVDLGSRWVGLVVGGGDLPLRHAVPPRTLAVDADNPEIVVGVIVEVFLGAGVTRAAVEFGRFYAGEAPTPAQATATANAWGEMKVLKHLLVRELERVGIEALVMERCTWSSRLVPHHRGGIKTAESNEAIRARCAVGAYEFMTDQHQRDAAGVLLGAWLVDAAPRNRRYRYRDRRKDKTAPRPVELTPEQKAERKRQGNRDRFARWYGYETTAERRAAGCTCPRKCVKTCPLFLQKAEAKRLEREAKQAARLADAIKGGPYLR